MAVVAVHHVPSLTQETYEQVVRTLTDGKGRLELPSDLPFDDLLVHAATQSLGRRRPSLYAESPYW